MMLPTHPDERTMPGGWIGRLARDRAGNTMAIVAASVAPLLALVGGGIDMGRSYLSETRLQQACDAGVLAARKKLGADAPTDGRVPAAAATAGQQFFNINFRTGSYGTEDRQFTMTLEDDFAISGVANVKVPTTIMKIFGNTEIPLTVECEARLNYSNTDVMMVLDTTGSMNGTNAGDSDSRIVTMRRVVKDFYDQIEISKSPGTRIRYGFVPYSTNVNVGHLLADDWVVPEWDYQSREILDYTKSTYNHNYTTNWQYVSGSEESSMIDSYPATYRPATSETGTAGYSCDNPAPRGNMATAYTELSREEEPYLGPPAGTKLTRHMRRVVNNTGYYLHRSGTTCQVWQTTYANLTHTYDEITVPAESNTPRYQYRAIGRDVAAWRSTTSGCMEERSTYEIDDYNAVDFDRALDLDLDRVPNPTDPDTQWRPMYPAVIYERSLGYNGTTGSFTPDTVVSTAEFMRPVNFPALVACPTQSMKLAELTEAQIDTYLASLNPAGATYHDIGMIWGGRLISPTGIFKDDNTDIDGKTTNRNLIFLTDGGTEPYDIAYGAYGVEPLDRRRWRPGSPETLTQVVENRFAVACRQVKNRNVTVWVIGFGTTMTDLMKNCAGPGHWFQADNADELTDAFTKIAKAMGDLRISK